MLLVCFQFVAAATSHGKDGCMDTVLGDRYHRLCPQVCSHNSESCCCPVAKVFATPQKEGKGLDVLLKYYV